MRGLWYLAGQPGQARGKVFCSTSQTMICRCYQSIVRLLSDRGCTLFGAKGFGLLDGGFEYRLGGFRTAGKGRFDNQRVNVRQPDESEDLL